MNPEEELVCMECNAEQDDCTCATCENCMANFSHADQVHLYGNTENETVWLCENCAEELQFQ